MVLTFDIDTLLTSIFDNIVSNQEIRHFVPLWPYISKVLHFWSSWLLTYLKGISLGTVWAIFLCNWLRLKISLSISPPFAISFIIFSLVCHPWTGFFFLFFYFFFFILVSKWSETMWLSSKQNFMSNHTRLCSRTSHFWKVNSPQFSCHGNQIKPLIMI